MELCTMPSTLPNGTPYQPWPLASDGQRHEGIQFPDPEGGTDAKELVNESGVPVTDIISYDDYYRLASFRSGCRQETPL